MQCGRRSSQICEGGSALDDRVTDSLTKSSVYRDIGLHQDILRVIFGTPHICLIIAIGHIYPILQVRRIGTDCRINVVLCELPSELTDIDTVIHQCAGFLRVE